MWRYIAKLRQKTDAEKGRFALITALSVTCVIALIWISTLSLKKEAIVASTSSPLQDLMATFQTLWENRPEFNIPLTEEELQESIN